ncbi:MAG TPA: hypothetical protein VGG75_32090 [Trebonia sp.]|jgi:hypothetical protein
MSGLSPRARRDGLATPSEEQEPLGVLLLPGKLEEIEIQAHARDLLSIPRVVALEPPRVRLPRFLRATPSPRQAKRLKFPGTVRLLVLYDPEQYPLARALLARHEDAELWYLPSAAPSAVGGRSPATGSPPAGSTLDPAAGSADDLLSEFDDLARERATQVLTAGDDGSVDDSALRDRLRELGIISPYAFVPGARTRRG